MKNKLNSEQVEKIKDDVEQVSYLVSVAGRGQLPSHEIYAAQAVAIGNVVAAKYMETTR